MKQIKQEKQIKEIKQRIDNKFENKRIKSRKQYKTSKLSHNKLYAIFMFLIFFMSIIHF